MAYEQSIANTKASDRQRGGFKTKRVRLVVMHLTTYVFFSFCYPYKFPSSRWSVQTPRQWLWAFRTAGPCSGHQVYALRDFCRRMER